MLIAIVATGFVLVVFFLIDTAQSVRQLQRAVTIQAHLNAHKQSAILGVALDGLEAILDSIVAPRCQAQGDCPNYAHYRIVELNPPGPDNYHYTCGDHDRWRDETRPMIIREEIPESDSRWRFEAALNELRERLEADKAQVDQVMDLRK